MKKYFIASLIRNGILGGGLIIDDEYLSFKTGKLTVPDEIRNLKIPFENISSVSSGLYLFLPMVTVLLKDGTHYRFIVTDRKNFIKRLKARLN